MVFSCALISTLLSIAEAIRGSPDACTDEKWVLLQHHLHQALDEFNPIAPLNLTKGLADLVDFVNEKTDILQGWELDNNDCWFGYALPYLLLSPHLSFTDETPQLEAEALSFLVLCPWQFWILTSPWRPIEVLLVVSKMKAADVNADSCRPLPESAGDVSAIMLEHSLPPQDGENVCERLHRAARLARVSLNHQRYFVAIGYGIYETHAIIEDILRTHWLEGARLSLTFTLLWEELLSLKPIHERGLLERKKGDMDEQLPHAGGLIQTDPPAPEAFAPAHNTSDRQDLVYAAQTVHEALEQHGIKYVMVAGTVIGTARYHGLNPWEHDCDLCIDNRRHYDLLKMILQQFTAPNSSLLYQRGVRLIASVRKGYSHKFSLSEARDFLELEESPSVTWGYPYGDIQECHGFADGPLWFGMREAWTVPRHLVIPRRKMLMHGVPMWGPSRPQEYVTAYLKAMYGYIDDWANTCRGHRHLNDSVIDCSQLYPFYHHVVPCDGLPKSFERLTILKLFYLSGIDNSELDIAMLNCVSLERSGYPPVYHAAEVRYSSSKANEALCTALILERDLSIDHEFAPFLRFVGLPIHVGTRQAGIVSYSCE